MSSYLVLARKYRPRTFAELVGQEVVAEVLAGALKEGRIGHAYLFSGPRGTGKTTTARILAKCLNCDVGPTPEPCGTCPRCEAADAGQEADIIELDAASHTGVDHIRALRDEVAYAPMRARHKVYIVDEVHMLSKQAFNALLKTLEEPPPHVVFVFATTEPHKVLDTILSRCQVLRLDPISEQHIAARLEHVFQAEGVEAGAGVVAELARAARGGMRDALSMADKLLALAGERPTLEDLQRLWGGSGTRVCDELLDALERGDRRALLERLAAHEGSEAELVSGLLERLRCAVLLLHCGAETPLVSATPEERAGARARGERLGAERLELWMQELLRARERLRSLAGHERVVVELALLELSRPESSLSVAELAQRLEALAEGAPLAAASSLGGPIAARAPAAGSVPASPAGSMPASTARAASSAPSRAGASAPSAQAPVAARPAERLDLLWARALDALAGGHGAFAELLRNAARASSHASGGIEVHLAVHDEKAQRLAHDRRSRAALVQALEAGAGRPLSVVWTVAGGSAASAAPVSDARERATGATDRGLADRAAADRAAADRAGVNRAAGNRAEEERAAALESDPGSALGPEDESVDDPEAEPVTRPAGRPTPKRPTRPDPFTQEVAELFGGVIEDL